MEYEFDLDPRGRPQARFSMDHEAFGHWLSSELGCNSALITQLLATLQQLKQRRGGEYQHRGHEFDLRLDADEVRVESHSMNHTDDLLEEALNYYDGEAHASCGLEDFEAVLLAWEEFIARV